MTWGPTRALQRNHIVTSAEATATSAEFHIELKGRVQLLMAQAWNETTPFKLTQISVYAQKEPRIGLPLKTIIQPSIRLPAEWTGELDTDCESVSATIRDPVAGDACILRVLFRAWLP